MKIVIPLLKKIEMINLLPVTFDKKLLVSKTVSSFSLVSYFRLVSLFFIEREAYRVNSVKASGIHMTVSHNHCDYFGF